jgi:hypothetical protein
MVISELVSPGLIRAQLLDSVVGFFPPAPGYFIRLDRDLLVELAGDAPAELLSATSV